jgi:hypothetical protein
VAGSVAGKADDAPSKARRGLIWVGDVPICPDVRRTFLVGAALLCLTGAANTRGTADQPLAVSVDGPGTIAAVAEQKACRHIHLLVASRGRLVGPFKSPGRARTASG